MTSRWALEQQAKEAQARATQAEHKQFVMQAKSELENQAHSHLGIILGAAIGLFGVLMTVIVIFFSLSTREAAIIAAKEAALPAAKEAAIAAAEKSVADIRDNIKKMADESGSRLTRATAEAEAAVAKIRDQQRKADAIARQILANKASKSSKDSQSAAVSVSGALAKSPRDRSTEDYQAIISDYLDKKQWTAALTAAQQMQHVYTEKTEGFAFARYNEGLALVELQRREEAVVVLDDVIARYGASKESALKVLVAKALVNKGGALVKMHRFAEAKAVYGDFIARYEGSEDPILLQVVGIARVIQNMRLGEF